MDDLTEKLSSADPFQSWWPIIVAVAFGVIMTIRTLMGGQTCPSTNNINEQIVIVTGGSGGMGFEICKELCLRSAHVIMACKDMQKAEQAMQLIKKAQKDAKIEIRNIDLRSFDCVRRFVRSIEKDFERVDILVNNAGLIFNLNEKTTDGFETHLQVNYLSHFLLTLSMLPMLKKSENGRVINVAAHAYSTGTMDVDDPLNIGTWSTTFHQRTAFAHSKLAVVIASRHLGKLLKDTTVTVNSYTPGLVRGTDHLRKSPVMNALCAKIITYPWMWLLMKNATQGVQTAVYLATEPKLKDATGEYFNDCEKSECIELAMDDKLAEQLYKHTIKALKMEDPIKSILQAK